MSGISGRHYRNAAEQTLIDKMGNETVEKV